MIANFCVTVILMKEHLRMLATAVSLINEDKGQGCPASYQVFLLLDNLAVEALDEL